MEPIIVFPVTSKCNKIMWTSSMHGRKSADQRLRGINVHELENNIRT